MEIKPSPKTSYEVTLITKGGLSYIPFVRLHGEMEDPMDERGYYLFAVTPKIPDPFSINSMHKVFTKKTLGGVDGVLLIDLVNHSIMTMDKKDLNRTITKLKNWRKHNDCR